MQAQAKPRLVHAAREILSGGVVAYPTEGVWGLGCDPYNREAVEQILKLKRRSVDKGLILVAASIQQVAFLLDGLSHEQHQALAQTWPGPNTWLIPHHNLIPSWVSGRFDTVAVRVSAHPTVRDLCQLVGGPIVSTSANPQGCPAARYGFQVHRYFRKAIAQKQLCLTPGQVNLSSKPSQIRDLISGRVIRQ